MEQFAENYNRRKKRTKQSSWPSSVGGFSCKDPIQMATSNSQNLISQATDKDSFLKAQGRKRTSQVHSKVTVLNKDAKNYLTLSGS